MKESIQVDYHREVIARDSIEVCVPAIERQHRGGYDNKVGNRFLGARRS